MLNIAVIFGGKSVEHDISVITGVLTLNSLNKTVYNPIPIFIDKNGFFYSGKLNTLKDFSGEKKGLYEVCFKAGSNKLFLVKGKKIKPILTLNCVINCTHGYNGEDGTISGLIKLCNIPLASPSVFSSAVAMDKEYTKIALKGLGIKTLKYTVFTREEFLSEDFFAEKLKVNYPIIIKPARLGSSIGITIAKDKSQIYTALEKSFKYDDKLLIEPLVADFTEINCAVYRGDEIVVSQLEKPISSSEILSFEDKYEGLGSREFPAKISEALSQKIKEISKKIYLKLGFSGIIRIDYILVGELVYVNEINSIPGSMAYYLFCNTFNSYGKMLNEIIDRAILEHSEFNKNAFLENTAVLAKSGNLKK